MSSLGTKVRPTLAFSGKVSENVTIETPMMTPEWSSAQTTDRS
jgi:hypothetical protein